MFSEIKRLWRLILALVCVLPIIVLWGHWQDGTLVIHTPAREPNPSALYAFPLSWLSLLSAAALLGPLTLGWSEKGRRLGGRWAGWLTVRGLLWLWPVYGALLAMQVIALPLEIAGFAAGAATLLNWIVWRTRHHWLRPLGRLRRGLRDGPRGRVLGRTATAVLSIAAAGWVYGWSEFMDGGVYHVGDTAAQLFHARIFTSGTLSLPAPDFPEFYRLYALICDERWFSQYPPGHSLVMAAFDWWGGLKWLMPMAAAAMTALTVFFASRFYAGGSSRRIGLTAAALMILSPFATLQFTSAMNHTTMVVWFLLFLIAYERSVSSGIRRRQRWLWGVTAGLAAGLGLITRPLTAVALVGAWMVWDGWETLVPKQPAGKTNKHHRVEAWGAWLTGALPPTVFLLYFNAATTGSPFLMGYIALQGDSHKLGFEPFVSNGHTPLIGLYQTLNNLYALSENALYGWPVTSLLFVLWLFLVGQPTRKDWRLLTTCGALAFAYFFYFYQDDWLGPRFLFEVVPLLAILTARGMDAAAEALSHGGGLTPSAARRGIYALVFLLSLSSLDFTYRWALNEQALGVIPRDRLHERLDRIFATQPEAKVFVGSAGMDTVALRNVTPTVGLRVLLDRGDPENARYMRAFPDDAYWLVRGDDVRPLRLAEGDGRQSAKPEP